MTDLATLLLLSKSHYPTCFVNFVHSFPTAQMQKTRVQMFNKRSMSGHIYEKVEPFTLQRASEKIGVARTTSLSVHESADREPTSRNYTKIAPAITPTTATAMELPTPLPILLPGAPFPLKELEEVVDEDEVPLEERLELDGIDVVAVTPNPVEDAMLREGAVVVTGPDLFGNSYQAQDKAKRHTHEDEVELEGEVELELELAVVTVAPIEKSPLVPKTELILLGNFIEVGHDACKTHYLPT